MSLLQMPQEVRTLIYEYFFDSITIHVCTLPSSAHLRSYPPLSANEPGELCVHVASARNRAPDLYLTAFVDDVNTDGNPTTSPFRLSTIPSLILTCRQLYTEVLQLTRPKFGVLNVDVYNVSLLAESHPRAFPALLQGFFSQLTILEVNLNYSFMATGLSLYAGHTGGNVNTSIAFGSGAGLMFSCLQEARQTLERSMRVLEQGDLFPGLRTLRLVFREDVDVFEMVQKRRDDPHDPWKVHVNQLRKDLMGKVTVETWCNGQTIELTDGL